MFRFIAGIADVPLEEAPALGAWATEALLPAFLGACCALLLARFLRGLGGRRGGARRTSAAGARTPPSELPERCARFGCGLEEFEREVEERLDAKLDRLEKLLKAADLVLAAGPGNASLGGDGIPVAHRETALGGDDCPGETPDGSGAQDPRRRGISPFLPGAGEPRQITPEERERILDLAASGRNPEAISEALGLLRGEVELILRLYRRETPARN